MRTSDPSAGMCRKAPRTGREDIEHVELVRHLKNESARRVDVTCFGDDGPFIILVDEGDTWTP